MYNNYTDTTDYQCCSVVLKEEAKYSLLLGDFNSPTDPSILAKYQIKTIITAAAGLEHLVIPQQINHIVFPLLDAKSENIREFFEPCIRAIDKNLVEGSVLIHCSAGISRSATLVIAYIMKKKKMSFREAIRIVRKKRKNVCPNLGFERQLKEYEKEIFSRKILNEKEICNPIIQKKHKSLHSCDISLKKESRNASVSKTAGEEVRRNILVSLYKGSNSSLSREKENEEKLKKGKYNKKILQNIVKDKISILNRRIGKIKQPVFRSYHKNGLQMNWAKT